MKKLWYELQQLLVLGSDLISEELLWYLRTVLLDVDKTGALASLAFCKEKPTVNEKGVYGFFYPELSSVALNLRYHHDAVLEEVQKESGMNTSFRLMLLVALTDTIIHEGYHAQGMSEEECRKMAKAYAWRCAETINPEIDNFGPFLEALIDEFHVAQRVDINSDDPGRIADWKRIQLHMLDNNLAWFDPNNGVEVKTNRRAMELHCMDERPWISVTSDRFRSFQVITPATTEDKEIHVARERVMEPEKPIAQEVPVEQPVLPGMQTTPPKAEEPSQLEGEAYIDDHADVQYEDYMDEASDWNDLDDDTSMSIDVRTPVEKSLDKLIYDAVEEVATVEAVDTPQEKTVVEPPPAPKGTHVHDIQRIAEEVLRTLFHHVYTKCGFNTDGGYNNAGAVLEPVDISMVPGADKVFVAQDVVTPMGQFKPRQPIKGLVKGCLSKGGLPQYKLYLNTGGNQLKKRTFIVQNPNKMRNGQPSPWAKEVRDGARIMMLLPEQMGQGPLAHLKLDPGTPLGQEEFVIWKDK